MGPEPVRSHSPTILISAIAVASETAGQISLWHKDFISKTNLAKSPARG
jgi:hypothetical protein